MKKNLLLCALAFLGFTGCAVDNVEIMEHTSQVNTGGTVTAKMIQMVTVFSNGSKLPLAVVRDSLHFAIGMPKGWTATSVQYYPALHFRMLRIVSGLYNNGNIDTLLLFKAMMDSLLLFESRKQPLAGESGMLASFSGLEFAAADSLGVDSTVNADSVDHWAGYRGPLGISLPAGSAMDTFFLDTAATLGFDTIGLSLIPVYVYVTLKAGTITGQLPVFYYGKSGTMPPPNDTSLNADKGSFAYYTVQVGPIAVEALPPAFGASSFWLNAYPNPAPGAVTLRYVAPDAPFSTVSVFSINGALVNTLSARAGSAFWDGTMSSGSRVQPGTYLMRLEAGGRSISKTVQIIQ